MANFEAVNFYGVGNLMTVARVCNGSAADTFRPISLGRPAEFTLEVTTEETMRYLQGLDGVSVPAIAVPTKREAKIMLKYETLNWSVIQLMANADAQNEALRPEFTVESAVFTATQLTYSLRLTPGTGVNAPSLTTMYLVNADGKRLSFSATAVAGVSFGYAAGVVTVNVADIDRYDVAYIGTRTGSQTTARVGGTSGKFGVLSFRGFIIGREGSGCNVDLGIYAPSCGRNAKLVLGTGNTSSTIDLMPTEQGGNDAVIMVPIRGGYTATSGTTV
jgi:hypothetical protein